MEVTARSIFEMPIDMIGAGVRKIEFCFNKWFGKVR